MTITQISLLIAMLAAVPAVPESRTAADAFARGRLLVEQNCGDCYKRSPAGVLEGVQELQRAISLGRDDAEVHRLLRDAYNGIAFIDYGNPGHEAENRRYAALMNEEIRVVAKLDPSDLENRLRYVDVLEGNDAKAELNEIVARFPKASFAHYKLARLFVVQGNEGGRPWRPGAGSSSRTGGSSTNTARASSTRRMKGGCGGC